MFHFAREAKGGNDFWFLRGLPASGSCQTMLSLLSPWRHSSILSLSKGLPESGEVQYLYQGQALGIFVGAGGRVSRVVGGGSSWAAEACTAGLECLSAEELGFTCQALGAESTLVRPVRESPGASAGGGDWETRHGCGAQERSEERV